MVILFLLKIRKMSRQSVCLILAEDRAVVQHALSLPAARNSRRMVVGKTSGRWRGVPAGFYIPMVLQRQSQSSVWLLLQDFMLTECVRTVLLVLKGDRFCHIILITADYSMIIMTTVCGHHPYFNLMSFQIRTSVLEGPNGQMVHWTIPHLKSQWRSRFFIAVHHSGFDESARNNVFPRPPENLEIFD